MKKIKELFKYSVITLITILIIIAVIIPLYFRVPLFANIKAEELQYLKRSQIQHILLTDNYYYVPLGENGDLQFIVEGYKLSNPEFPKLEVIYEVENKNKEKTVSDLPTAVVIYQKQKAIESTAIDLSGSNNLKSLILLIMDKVNRGIMLLTDTKEIEKYDLFTRFLIKLKTSFFRFERKVSYSSAKAQTVRWILATEKLPEKYKKLFTVEHAEPEILAKKGLPEDYKYYLPAIENLIREITKKGEI